MPLLFNLRHLQRQPQSEQGQLTPQEIDLDPHDEMIHVTQPLHYDLQVELIDKSVWVHGQLQLTLDCECVRCLKPFQYELRLDNWHCHLPLEGEDRVSVVNDCVDLTPYVREDILLAFPQHPVCEPGCAGLASPQKNRDKKTGGWNESTSTSSAWAELNKLRF
jgi:uncharacterized protein